MAIEIRLKEVMKEKGITGRKLAEMLDSTPQYISNICNGRQNMSLDMLNRIAELIGVGLWELLVNPDDVRGDGDFVALVRRKKELYCFNTEKELYEALMKWDKEKVDEAMKEWELKD